MKPNINIDLQKDGATPPLKMQNQQNEMKKNIKFDEAEALNASEKFRNMVLPPVKSRELVLDTSQGLLNGGMDSPKMSSIFPILSPQGGFAMAASK